MKTMRLMGCTALLLTALTLAGGVPAFAGEGAKAAGALGSVWAFPQEAGKVTLVIAGQADPVTVAVTDKTIFSGICLDCNLPLEFKPDQTGKKCMVCGCSVSNAACIVGKPVKEGTWQAMLKALPRGVGVRPTFNTAGSPESGASKVTVDLRSVLLPVTGLDTATPDQLLALVKPLGGTSAEMVDGGKRLSIHLKTDWTIDRETKLEKALAKLNGKVDVPDAAK